MLCLLVLIKKFGGSRLHLQGSTATVCGCSENGARHPVAIPNHKGVVAVLDLLERSTMMNVIRTQ
jgi:hypothetical protein